ncbi:hypothetical protein DUI87_17804 [Hirundo rustica rustica]|uniref:Uncharacterized protein n=1 Tax=Hirundo rustica rustica TaxID=333673 RepID=A0A3M0KBT7_HIRRU|nr:hypothetical protein DUI87_17804 [Hirundo rustica rustica]
MRPPKSLDAPVVSSRTFPAGETQEEIPPFQAERLEEFPALSVPHAGKEGKKQALEKRMGPFKMGLLPLATSFLKILDCSRMGNQETGKETGGIRLPGIPHSASL